MPSPDERSWPGVAEHPVAAGLAAVAGIGPFFGVEMWRRDAEWRSLAELVDRPAVLTERVGAARKIIAQGAGVATATIEERVAASIVFLGLSARLTSPPVGMVLLTGVVPRWTVAGLWWRPVAGGPWPIAMTATPGWLFDDLSSPGQLDAAADCLLEVVSEVVGPVLGVFADRFRLSRKILWGNVASGFAGGIGMFASAQPRDAGTAADLAQRMLDRGPLRGTGELTRRAAPGPRVSFRRRSCCLFYRVPGAGTCGDCVLTSTDPRPGRPG